MRRYLRMVKRLAGIGLMLGLGIVGAAQGLAQQAPTDEPPTAKGKEPGKVKVGEPIPAPTEAAPIIANEDSKGKMPKGFWEKNPPIWPVPRAGVFFVPPETPGYYSLCDQITDNEREKPPPFPYSRTGAMFGSFFNANFLYMEDPNNQYHDPIFDCLHRIHFGDCWMFSTGGEERLRLMDEQNSRLSGKDNRYMLERTRVYGDLWYSNIFRVYVEAIDARSTHQTLNPLPIDQNHGDLLNAFIDLNVVELWDHPLYVRGGRQEMLLGSERLISPLDWANTRRTFQGVSAFRQGDNFDFTAFWLQPVGLPKPPPSLNAGANPDDFDSVDNRQNFYGLWTTYRPEKGQTIDLYFLDLNNANANAASGANGVLGPFNCYTVGARSAGDYEHFLWDFEGMYQWGHWSNQETSAGAYTTALGYNFAKAPANPTMWFSWDWASGNHDPNGPEHGTFNQLFPFNHYYFGQMDLIGRQNIEDFNIQLTAYPTNWWVVNFWWNCLWLESPNDALYSPGNAPLRVSPTGTAGRFVGNMLTVTSNFHIDAHQDILVGYSNLCPGDFIRNTGTGESPRPQLFYVQYTFRW
jgi:hypothetical protein